LIAGDYGKRETGTRRTYWVAYVVPELDRRLAERGRNASRQSLNLSIGGPQPNPAGHADGRDFREGRRLPVACARNHERHAAVPGSGKQSGNARAGHCRRSTRGPRY
jgi:hypothetical protein